MTIYTLVSRGEFIKGDTGKPAAFFTRLDAFSYCASIYAKALPVPIYGCSTSTRHNAQLEENEAANHIEDFELIEVQP